MYWSHIIILDQSCDIVIVYKCVQHLYQLQSSFKDIYIINITHDIILSLQTPFISFKITFMKIKHCQKPLIRTIILWVIILSNIQTVYLQ